MSGDAEGGSARRVQPDAPASPARAWLESEEPKHAASPASPASPFSPGSPAESRCLLAPTKPAPARAKRLEPRAATKKPLKFALPTKYENSKPKSKMEKLMYALRPPYFIMSMIVTMVCSYLCVSQALRARLDWWPASAWWRQPWRLVTYGAVHASGAHVAMNALVAAAVGWLLEREQRWWRVAGVWAGGLAAGALGAGAANPSVRVVGASAAVYATLTSHLPNVCYRYEQIPMWWFRLVSVVVLAASESSWALLMAPEELSSERVAWEAHVCGALAGVPLAFLLFTGENRSRRWAVWARAASALALAGGAVLAALHYSGRAPPAPAARAARPATVRELT